MKTLREMMDLIESAQAGVAEGYEAVCPSCHSADVKTYSDGEKECNHCHKTWDVQGVAESGDELYQQAIRKYVQRVANNYLGGGNAHLYGAGNFDSEMFGVDPKQAEQDFDRLFPQYLKKLQGGKQLEETTPDAMAKIDNLFRK